MTSMEKTFYFVDGLHADGDSRKLMRRHVMKGKNVGKKIVRRSRLECRDVQPPMGYSSASIVSSHHGSLPALPFPVKVTRDSLEVINEFFVLTADRIYPVQLGISLHDAKLMYLKDMLADEAAYHCNVALMRACNEMFSNNGEAPPNALRYLSKTFTEVQKRLESDRALSDSTIAIVLSLIHQEQIRHQQWAAAIHMKGLHKMIELRGGLSKLEDGSAVMLKICKTDIMFALQQGGSTMFFRDRMPQLQAFMLPREQILKSSGTVSLDKHYRLDPCLEQVYTDITNVCALFSNDSGNREIDLVTFHEIIISPCYRLLRFRTLSDARQLPDIQSAYHIGLLVFMMTMFLQCGPRRLIQYRLIALCLKDTVELGMSQHKSETVLWLTMIGGIWISSDGEDEWLVSSMRTTTAQLGIKSWDEARGAIAGYPWIVTLHDQPGRRLWTRVNDE